MSELETHKHQHLFQSFKEFEEAERILESSELKHTVLKWTLAPWQQAECTRQLAHLTSERWPGAWTWCSNTREDPSLREYSSMLLFCNATSTWERKAIEKQGEVNQDHEKKEVCVSCMHECILNSDWSSLSPSPWALLLTALTDPQTCRYESWQWVKLF